jgi:hypothetical protein
LAPTLSYCVVNTNGRDYLLACLEAIERTHPAGIEREVLVLDNASDDGSAAAVRGRGGAIRLIALERRAGKAENDSTLMREAKGRYCLLLNEDSNGRGDAALVAALDAEPKAARGRSCWTPGRPSPAPGVSRVGTALAGFLFLHRSLTVQARERELATSTGPSQRPPRPTRAAAEVGYSTRLFVYYDECDFAKRLADAGWHPLRPGCRGTSTTTSSPTSPGLPHRRIPPQPRLTCAVHHSLSAALRCAP